MKHTKVIDEYDLHTGEFNSRLGPFLVDKGFKIHETIPNPIGFEFSEASSILDTKAGNAYCGRIIDYPWGFGNNGVHAIRDTRLEEAIKEYIK